MRPNSLIIGRAEERGIPIILTHHNTITALKLIGDVFGKTRFHQEKKTQLFESLLDNFMDFETLYKAVGIAPETVKQNS